MAPLVWLVMRVGDPFHSGTCYFFPLRWAPDRSRLLRLNGSAANLRCPSCLREFWKMTKAGCLVCSDASLRRRDFLRVGSLSLLGINLSQYLRLKHATAASASSPSKKAQACILLWLEGGPSQMDTWDPKPNSPFRPISTNVPGIQISELLPRLAKQMDKLSIIRTMYTEENNHPQASYYAMTGHRPNPAMEFPGFGSIITKETGPRNDVPPHVLTPQWENDRQYEEYFKASFLGAEYDPLIVPDASSQDFKLPDLTLPKSITLERLQDRRSFLKVIDRRYREKARIAEQGDSDTFTQQAQNMILSPAVRDAFDLSKEPETIKDAYGRNGFGQSVLLARRLVEAGSRFVTAAGYKFNAWDTHNDNDRIHRDQLVPVLDQALATLLGDLDQRGLLESTIVLAIGEFGRTPHHNPNGGRDHWSHCWSMALGGGGLRGGQVVGASDDRGAYLSAGRKVTIGDLFATVYKAFGIDWHKEYMHPIGRPVKIANSENDHTGEPVTELI
jgi:hypothetical protein